MKYTALDVVLNANIVLLYTCVKFHVDFFTSIVIFSDVSSKKNNCKKQKLR